MSAETQLYALLSGNAGVTARASRAAPRLITAALHHQHARAQRQHGDRGGQAAHG